MLWSCLSLALLGTISPFPAATPQEEVEHVSPDFRQQLGMRVIRMERAFEVASEERRAASVDQLIETVEDFFSARFQSAAAGLDTATAYLEGRDAPHWSDSLALTCDPWLEEHGESCRVTLAQYYPANIPTDAQYRVMGQDSWQELGTLPRTLSLSLQLAQSTELSEIDEHLTWTIQIRQADGQPTRTEEFRVSRVENFRTRARDVQTVERRWRKEGKTWRSETARLHLELLLALSRGEQQEIWLDGARLLQAAEALVYWSWNEKVEDLPTVADWIRATPQLSGEHLVAWPGQTDQGRRISRIQFPTEIQDGVNLPTVIALHGSGGTENMFFSSYGAGKITGLAREHGFLLLSPRVPSNMDLASYINEAVKHLPIDQNRIYVVGHSMGAGVAQRKIYTRDANFRATALVGGGRESERALHTKHPALWLAAGERDFARGGLTGLSTQLQEAGAEVTFLVYPNCEHLTVMQLALPDVFEWFKKLDDEYLASQASAK